MDKSVSGVFGGGASSGAESKRRKLSQFVRATEFNDKLKALQAKIDNSISLVHHLIGGPFKCREGGGEYSFRCI